MPTTFPPSRPSRPNRPQPNFSTPWKKVFHTVEKFSRNALQPPRFFHTVEIIFP